MKFAIKSFLYMKLFKIYKLNYNIIFIIKRRKKKSNKINIKITNLIIIIFKLRNFHF